MLRLTPSRGAALLALGAALACASLPASAHAEARTSDIVLGKTAAAREIDISELPELQARHGLVMGADGTVYFEREADAPIKIASVTKIMTALVALENSELDEIVVTDHAAANVGESVVGLEEGDALTMEEALTGLMVMSGNDTAMAIAAHVGENIDPKTSDPLKTFVEAMNERAAELGCKNTVFSNPHGLDFGAWTGDLHSTTREIMQIYAECMKNEQFRSLDNSDRTQMHVTSANGSPRTIDLLVRNKIRGQEGNIGGKTGSTYDAGDCFVSAFSRETGGEIYVAVFGADNDTVRFEDTLELANWHYGHLAALPFANTPSKRGDTPILAEATCTDWSDKTAAVTVADGATSDPVFTLAGDIEQKIDLKDLDGAVDRGADAGTISYLQNGEVVGEARLVTAESVAGTSPFEWVMVRFDRMLRFFQGMPGTAASIVLNEAPDPLAFDAWNA